MSGDLRDPKASIPLGTFSAIGTCAIVYLIFIFGLGATCERFALLQDYMIAQKVSVIGFFLLAGLYISSMSTALGALYAAPRIIQNMFNENIIPALKIFAKGYGPNKIPIYASILFGFVVIIFVMMGNINLLAPIVTIQFLMTFSVIEYAYFSLLMTIDMQRLRSIRFMPEEVIETSPSLDTSQGARKPENYGAVRVRSFNQSFTFR